MLQYNEKDGWGQCHVLRGRCSKYEPFTPFCPAATYNFTKLVKKFCLARSSNNAQTILRKTPPDEMKRI